MHIISLNYLEYFINITVKNLFFAILIVMIFFIHDNYIV